MIRASILFIALASLSVTGCNKKKEEGGAAPTASKSGEAAAAKAGPTKLPKLNLQIDVPGSVEVGDALMADEGHMLQGSTIGAMQVEVAKTPQTVEEAKSDAEMYSPKNLKDEKLADGWALTFDNTGSAGANFFVQVRRDIGGKQIACTTTTDTAARAQAVLAACKSLRP